jgi:copper resistance protein C
MLRRVFTLALCLFATLAAAPAYAHAYLKTSDPAANSIVPTTPHMLLLTYTEELNLAFCTVTITDSMGMNDEAGKPQPVPGHANEMQVPLAIQMPGKIFVTWHALSTDGHKTQGNFSFTVADH